MKIVIFSDFHAHNWHYGAEYQQVGKNVYNTRLLGAIKSLMSIKEYCKNWGIEHVVFTGDLFHTFEKVHVDVYNIVLRSLASFVTAGLHIHMIPGNHDYADKQGTEHALKGLDLVPNIHVYDELTSTVLSSSKQQKPIHAIFIPYIRERSIAVEEYKKASYITHTGASASILFGHQGIQGAKVGADYVLESPSDMTVEELYPHEYKQVFLGHYHDHQKVADNVWYVGATYQHNWADAGKTRGFVVYDSNLDSTFQVPMTVAPKFHVLEEGDSYKGILPQDFVTILTNQEILPAVLGIKAAKVEVKPPKSKDAKTVEEFEFSLDMKKAIQEWVNKNPPPVEKKMALKIGQGLYSSVMSKLS